MQSIIALLAVLVGAAVANQKILSSDELKRQNRRISASEYLRKTLEKSPKLYFDIDVGSQDDLLAKIPAMGLHEASQIAEQVNLRQILRDEDLASVTLCLPSDKAVQKWRQELPDRLQPDHQALKQLVKAWIVSGMIRSSDVHNNQKVQSLNGAKLRFNIYKYDGKKVVTVNGARITDADRMASNGIIQVVDKVIYPLPIGNVVQTLAEAESFSMIVDLLKQADLKETLEIADPITAFVPTNSAFRALQSGVLDDLKRNQTELRNVLKYHVIFDVRYSASLSSGQTIRASQGEEISVTMEKGKILLNKDRDQAEASVIKADIPTTNGVVHIIDHVLFPSKKITSV